MRVGIETMTPVHIGTGNQHDTLYYHIENNIETGGYTCYFLDIQKIVGALSALNQQAFSQWVDEAAIEFSQSDNKNVSNARKKFTLASFMKDRLGIPEIECSKLLTSGEGVRYSAPVKSEQGNRYLIVEHVRTPDHNLFIPGSSLKGAIRTALGFRMIGNMEQGRRSIILKSVMSRISEEYPNRIGRAEELIDEQVFNCSGEKGYRQYFDLMKFISVSDSFLKELTPCIYQVSTITENKRGSSTYNVQNLNLFEMIDGGLKGKLLFHVNFNYEQFRAVAGRGEWQLLDEKCRLAFGVSAKELVEMKAEADVFVVKQCFDALGELGAMVLRHDMKWAEQRFGTMDPVFKMFKGIEKEIPAMTFKIGYASGFHAMTYYCLREYRETEHDFHGLYKEIIRKQKLDVPISRRRSVAEDREVMDSTVSMFPSSRRFVTGVKNELISPIGWVKPVILDK